MYRLIALLCAGILVTLVIAGRDEGQMRPALAEAAAEGRTIPVIARPRVAPRHERADSRPADTRGTDRGTDATAEPAAVARALADPARGQDADAALAEAARPVRRQTPPAPVFTLSALGNASPDDTTEAMDQADIMDERHGTGGAIRRVQADVVNIRQGPSTGTEVIGRLVAGEEVTVLGPAGADWVEIEVVGDGAHGFIAAWLLAPG